MNHLNIRSYAKINLGLWALRKRPDGYHEIETVMQTVDLTDEMTVTGQRSGTVVTCTEPSVPTDERNLVTRAVHLLRERTDVRTGVRIHIDKRIPVAAGLAGGSGNGAMTLVALNHLWHLNLSVEDLTELAAYLGSDTPFCMTGGTAVARGRGERLEFLDVSCPGVFVLVNPPCMVSSAWAYQHLKIDLTNVHSCINFIVCTLRQGDMTPLASQLHNDLEEPVLSSYPVVAQVKQSLLDCGAKNVLMSGSGPTVFGMVPDLQAAEQVAGRIRRVDADWRVFVASPVSRSEIRVKRGF